MITQLRLLGWLGMMAVLVWIVIPHPWTLSWWERGDLPTTATIALDELGMSQQSGRLQPTTLQSRIIQPMFLYLPQMLYQDQPLDAMRLTYATHQVTQPTLSPDGKTLLYLDETAGQQDLYAWDSVTGTSVNLTQTPTVTEDTPVFAPDGKQIAFASKHRGDWDIYLLDATGRNLRLGVGLPGSDEVQPAFTPDGNHLLFSSNRADNNWDIYSATISSTVWVRLTSDLAVERFPTVSADGSTIALRRELSTSVSNTVNSEVYVISADGAYRQQLTDHPAFDGYPVITPDGSGVVFVSGRTGRFELYTANIGGITQPLLDLPPSWQLQTPRLTVDGRSLVFAASRDGLTQIYRRAYTSPLVTVGQRGFGGLAGNCDWQAGVLAYGWAKAWRTSSDPAYRQWLLTWVDGCLAAGEPIDHVNDGLLGYAALIAYQATSEQRYLTLAETVADYLLSKAKRTTNGTLTHLNDDTVWDDTLVVVTPFLVEMGRVSNNRRYWDEAATQVVKHAQILQDAQTGLYHHAWQESSAQFLGATYWGRGNGWVLVASAEILAVLPVDHPQSATILANFQRHAAALLARQAASGLWPTVITQPTYDAETSGSALIAAALLDGVAAGWLDRQTFYKGAQHARFALWRQVQVDGTVTSVSAPTGPMGNDVDYNNIVLSPFELYGQGAILLLGAARVPSLQSIEGD